MSEHIKMPDVTPVVQAVANGSQTVFNFPFPIFASEDLKIFINGVQQTSGFVITGAGQTAGGQVSFVAAPAANAVITLERRLPIERMTDFIESGEFAAAAINTELDYITAGMQQLERDQAQMLRWPQAELGFETALPQKSARAGKALGFDGNGGLTVYETQNITASPDFLAGGSGAAPRSVNDKLKDCISVKDFGAQGDGVTDDSNAFLAALAAHNHIYVPQGTYRITQTIILKEKQSLIGAGQGSKLITSASITVLKLEGDYNTIAMLRIEGGETGLLLKGDYRPCVNNAVLDCTFWQQQTGIVLDGGVSGGHPCYWNNFARVLVAQPFNTGIHLFRSGLGDTPNANRFMQCRVYSLGANTSGAGLFVEAGSFNNSFVDFEVNVAGTAQACVRIGAGSNKTLLVNLYTESTNTVPNVKLEAGSIETSIYNHLSASNGAAIWDLSGGQYSAYNAGYPYKNKLQRTTVNDLNTTLQRYDTEYIDTSGTITLDTSHSVHLVSSFGGALTVNLPNAGSATGCMMVIKKIDSSKNVITVAESSGVGPDGTSYFLGSENDYVQMLSNGAEWFVISSNRSAGNTRFYDGTGIYDIDMAVDTYLLSSFGGALTARLPPANAAKAAGRTITIKKTDVSANAITVSVQGGGGLDGYTQSLTAQYHAITVVSDGGQWFILSRLP